MAAIPYFSIEPLKALSPASRALPIGQSPLGQGFAGALDQAGGGFGGNAKGGLDAEKIAATSELILNQGLMDILGGEGEAGSGEGGGLNGAMNAFLINSLLGGQGGMAGMGAMGGMGASLPGGLPEGLGELAALARTFPGGMQGMVDALRRLAADPASFAEMGANSAAAPQAAVPGGPASPAGLAAVDAAAPAAVSLPAAPPVAAPYVPAEAAAPTPGLARASGLKAYGQTARQAGGAAQVPGHPAALVKPDLFSQLLGRISARFESGGDPAAVGYDRVGGTSYGIYQLSSRAGTMDQFVGFLEHKRPAWAAVLDAAGPANTGSAGGAMPAAWRALAAQDPEGFAALQREFIGQHHFLPAAQRVKEITGLDLAGNPALAEVLWSTAVQHGPTGAASIVSTAVEAAGPSGSPGFAANLVNEVYARRAGQFGSSDTPVQEAVQSRLKAEREEALSLLRVGGMLDSEV